MNRKIWLGLALLAAVAVAVSLIALPRGSEWTTDSPEALAEFNEAIDATMKLYRDEVQAHLERALELDPDFVMAKLFLAEQIRYDDEDRAKQLWEEVQQADRSKLSPREVFYIERDRAYQEDRYDDAARMLDEYLVQHPNDPFILHEQASRAWKAGGFEEAERLNRRLIEIAPNWVIAYNQLGYIAMSQGRFVEAEEYFTSYRFVAPDQANPHDSLGELYIILGRHEEAETALRQSIETKRDFWAAYEHLILVRLREQDFAGAEAVLDEARAAGGLPDYWGDALSCTISIAVMAEAEQWQALLDTMDDASECGMKESAGYPELMMHQAACRLGDFDTARAIENKIEEAYGAAEEVGRPDRFETLGLLSHLRGVRRAVEGDLAGAVEAYSKADENITYMQAGSGLFKLHNRLHLVEALFANGQDGEAHKVLSKVRSVNPTLVREFEEEGLRILGLDR